MFMYRKMVEWSASREEFFIIFFFFFFFLLLLLLLFVVFVVVVGVRWSGGDETLRFDGRQRRQRLRQRQVSHGRVLAVAVPAQVHLALEGFVAQAARERFVAGVLAHVGDQVGRLAERLAAHDTLVRLLSCWFRVVKRERETRDERERKKSVCC